MKSYNITFVTGQCEIVDNNEQKIIIMKMTSNDFSSLKMNWCLNIALESEVADETHL